MDDDDTVHLFHPERCACALGTCFNRATVEGLCDRCFMEYSALRNVHMTSAEWH